jgi:two-component system sensor histidine kinase KdpD
LAQRERELVDAIHDEALRMTGIVTNLLDMARLQAGSLQIKRQWSLLEETVGAALAACKRVLARHPARVSLPADLPLLQMDAVLMERLFTNLFENAAKYTPADAPIEIGAERVSDDGQPFVRVYVDDHGPGLPHGMERASSTSSRAARRNRRRRASGSASRSAARSSKRTAVKSARSTAPRPTDA